MKKNLLILIVLSITLVFTGCKSNTSSNGTVETSNDNIEYVNETYNFRLQLPKTWEDKYYVEEGDKEIYFYHKNDLNDERKAELFTIHVSNTENEWEELEKEYEVISIIRKVIEDEQGIISITSPTDRAYSEEEKEYYEEYKKMENDKKSIEESIERLSK